MSNLSVVGNDARTAIVSGYRNWRIFNARSSRREFWWFALFVWLVSVVVVYLDVEILYWLFAFVLAPVPAVWVRRIHDTGHRVWWCVIPVVGGILNLVFLLSPTDVNETRWQSADLYPRSLWPIERWIGAVMNRRGGNLMPNKDVQGIGRWRSLFFVPVQYRALAAQGLLVAMLYNGFKVAVEPRSSGEGACGSLLRPVVSGRYREGRIGWFWDYGDAICSRMMNGRLWELGLSIVVVVACAQVLQKLHSGKASESSGDTTD